MAQEFDIELMNNQEQRLPCILILDTSSSMSGNPINELQSGLDFFAKDVKSDDDASQKVQIMVIKCGGEAEIISDWIDAESFESPDLHANGMTPMGAAVDLAVEEIEKRKKEYRDNGVSYLKPWIFIISDGAPNDNWESSASNLKQLEKDGKFTVFTIAVEDADQEILSKFSIREPQKLQGIEFNKLFEWISASVRIGSQKVSDSDKTTLPPIDWASV
tara:strand:- start:135 stop:788 length:654 start_codon:yes stop_codon:yes gene_type:complete